MDGSYEIPEVRKFEATCAQSEAIARALRDRLTLIQGPPGCGKTAFITALVYHFLRQGKGEKIMVCGTSNVSVENLVKMLAPVVRGMGKKVVWLATGRRDQRPSSDGTPEEQVLCYQQMLTRQTAEGEEFRQLEESFSRHNYNPKARKRAGELRRILEYNICVEADVVCCTLESSLRECLCGFSFPVVIMDEATQAVEPSSLIPLLHDAQKIVLVGDQNQLGPVVPSEFKRYKFNRGLFVRLLQLGLEHIMLDEQFRMHPMISEFPNRIFYDGAIRNGVNAADRTVYPPLLCFPDSNAPILLWDVRGTEREIGKSYTNEDEVNVVHRIIQHLLKSGIAETQIGVISPYAAQVIRLQLYGKSRYPHVKIASVDSFQGGEKDFVIVSCVRSGNNGIGFLKSKRRLCVTLTRARFGLFIVGNPETLSTSTLWKALVDHYRQKRVIVNGIPRIRIDRSRGPALDIQIPAKNNADAPMRTDEVFEDSVESVCNIAEKGFDIEEIECPVSKGMMRVIWPEIEEDIAFLSEWANRLIEILDSGKFVTLAFRTEAIDTVVLSLQFGEVYNEEFDILSPDTPDAIPAVGDRTGVIVFCVEKTGRYNVDPIQPILTRLLRHERIVIATFDFTNDILNLHKIGIRPKLSRVLDAQLLESDAWSPVTYNSAENLAAVIQGMSLKEDRFVERAKKRVHDRKNFPFDANVFVLELDHLPCSAMVTKNFLEYAADAVPLIGLAMRVVLCHRAVDEVQEKTQEKIGEYKDLQQKYDRTEGPFVRYCGFSRMDLPIILRRAPDNTDPEAILGLWRKLKILLMVHEISSGEELICDQSDDEIRELVRTHTETLKLPDMLVHIRGVQLIVEPPGTSWNPYMLE
jgi:hypothetical protein